MAVRMPHVHLPNVPCHGRRRPSNVELLFNAMLVNSIHVIHPNRYPGSLVGAFIASWAERHFVIALASAALSAFAEKDFTFSRADSSESGRVAPVPCLLPTELFEPGEALLDIRDIQYRRQPF